MAGIDLTLLPKPAIVQEISADAIVADSTAALVAEMPEIAGYATLEGEPSRAQTKQHALRETLVRARINDAARANLLAYAEGTDLDHLGAFYDVARMGSESDDRYRLRITLANQSPLTGGTAPRYRYHALSASLDVRDVEVYRSGTRPVVNVAVYAASNGGVASNALISAVQSALDNVNVRMVSDTILVRSAVFRTVNVSAQIWLLPDAPDTIVADIPAFLAAEWDSARGLGFDMVRSWLIAKLMRPGVSRVSLLSPAADEIAAPEEALAMGTVTIINMGRAY